MKKISLLTSSLLVVIGLSSSYVFKDLNGRANATGSPGEVTCNNCHGGGSSSVTGVSVSAVPAFVNNEYYPDSTYAISVSVQADGFTRFGFGCEILDVNNVSAGTMTLAGSGVKFLGPTTKRNAVHSSPKTATNSIGVFNFKWKAPAMGTGQTTFYVCGNAVNGNNSTSGDLPIPSSYVINEGIAPIDSSSLNPNAIAKFSKNVLAQLQVAPNPANDVVQVLYDLNASASVNLSLYQMNGTLVKTVVNERQFGGENNCLFSTQGLEAGAYFLKISCDGQQQASKLLMIR